MEREKALWTARAGDYAETDRPDTLLALRVEELTSREATEWVALQSQSDGRQPDADHASTTHPGSGARAGDGADAAAASGTPAPDALSPGASGTA